MSLAKNIASNVEKVFLGKPEAVRLAVTCLLAEGHLLIDDIPGVGKTTMALALAKSIGCGFQRIQFTSDLLPSDVLGMSIYNQKTQSFDFKPGPVFHSVILADEINRSSPKTQSALLEAMQERQVSMDNQTHALPKPFFVIATENPHEHHGTFPLPESQLDRFMMRIRLGYPAEEVEHAILKGDTFAPRVHQLSAVTDAAEIQKELLKVTCVAVDGALDQYMVSLARATRESPLIDMGLSPRGTLALRRAAQAFAVAEGRNYMVPDDVKAVGVPVIAHRIRLRGGAHYNGNSARTAESLVHDILGQVAVPV